MTRHFEIEVAETVTTRKIYILEAETASEAIDKAAIGDTVREDPFGAQVGITAVVGREPDVESLRELGADELAEEQGADGPLVDVESARLACRTLVEAYASNPEDVDWDDVQASLAHALKALGLPQDYPEKTWQNRLEREEAQNGTQSIESSVLDDLGLS